jgi:hypothetical protein
MNQGMILEEHAAYPGDFLLGAGFCTFILERDTQFLHFSNGYSDLLRTSGIWMTTDFLRI